ncbi:hypothetical protein RBB78_20510 [Tunturiibacter empetritectus]|uniref:hypothetical protein n=1 Tax=Tunturiibacter empetritectus TaxID=3069691 RepID=UPI003D9BCA71
MHDVKAGYGEGSGGVEFELIGESGELFFERRVSFGEGLEAGVAAEFGEGAGDSDGAELFEDVGVAGDGGLDGEGCVLRLVGADDFEDGGDFSAGKPASVRMAGLSR